MAFGKWLHAFSAQYAAGIAVVATLAVFGVAAGIAYWAYRSATGPVLATAIFCLGIALFLGFCGVLWLKDRREGKDQTPLAASVNEQDALARLEKAQRDLGMRAEIIQKRNEFIGQAVPKIRWADSLIARERSAPAAQFMRVSFVLNRERYLAAAEAEPYFDIDILIDYKGALRLVIEIVQLGHLSWNDRPFAIAPKVTHSESQELPFDAEGPTACYLAIRQHVSKDKAAEMKSALETNGELLLITKELRISASRRDFAGETVAVVESILGNWLEIKPRPK